MSFGRQKNIVRRASRPDENYHRLKRRKGVDRSVMLEGGRGRRESLLGRFRAVRETLSSPLYQRPAVRVVIIRRRPIAGPALSCGCRDGRRTTCQRTDEPARVRACATRLPGRFRGPTLPRVDPAPGAAAPQLPSCSSPASSSPSSARSSPGRHQLAGLRLTHSPRMLGVVGFAAQIPMFVLAPFAGVWVDRVNRRGSSSSRRSSRCPVARAGRAGADARHQRRRRSSP